MANPRSRRKRDRDQRAFSFDPALRAQHVARRRAIDARERDLRGPIEAEPNHAILSRNAVIDALAPVEHQPAVSSMRANADADAGNGARGRGGFGGLGGPCSRGRAAEQVDDDRLLVDEAPKRKRASQRKPRRPSIVLHTGVADIGAENARHRNQRRFDPAREGDAENVALDPRPIGDGRRPVEHDSSKPVVGGGAQSQGIGCCGALRNDGEDERQRQRKSAAGAPTEPVLTGHCRLRRRSPRRQPRRFAVRRGWLLRRPSPAHRERRPGREPRAAG